MCHNQKNTFPQEVPSMKEYKVSFKYKLLVFLLIFILLSVLTGIIIRYFYLQNISKNKLLLETNEMARIEEQQKIIKTDFDQIIADLFFLANFSPFQNVFENESQESLMQLGRDILTFSTEKKIYDQIRYIDQNGKEIFQVNYNNGNPFIVPQKLLQNKLQPNYFQETISLGKGELYLSPFDLNIEKGEIEKPLKPIIRFGTPVFNRSGQKQGILILNYLGDIILKRLRTVSEKVSGRTMMLNTEGYWILGPSPDLEWGFMYENKKNTILEKYDSVAYTKIYGREQGQLYTKRGLFSFITIYPFLEPSKAGVGEMRSFSPKRIIKKAQEYYWKIISFVPSNQLYEMHQNIIQGYVKLFLFSLAISGILLWFSTDQYFKRKTASEDLKNYATYDEMTGFLNRRMGLLFLEKELKITDRTNTPFTLCYIDINNLKMVNDTFGHEEGDYLILTSTRLLKESIRETDILCRLGGDEFFAILRECTIEQAEKIWQKVVEKIENFNSKKLKPYQVSLSHGFVQYNPKEGKKADQLITETDAKMYREKKKYKQAS
jgi:diguanylate cyclase (GGDEF)-like protein